MSSSPRVVLVAVAIVATSATHVFGQTGEIPGGLFGNGDSRDSRHKLDFSLSLVEAHDSDTPRELVGFGPGDLFWSGYSTMFNATGDYRWQGSRVQVGAKGTSGLRYLNQLGKLEPVGSADALIAAQLSGRSTVQLNETVAFMRSPVYGLFPGDPGTSPGDTVAAAPDYVIHNSAWYTRSTTASVDYGLTPRSRVSATAELEDGYVLRDGRAQPGLTSRWIRGEFSRSLLRHVTIDVGYHFQTADFAHGAGLGTQQNLSVREHGLDLGVNYVRPVSPTRQFVLGARFRSSAVDTPGSGDGLDVSRRQLVSSDVSAGYRFKTWQLRGTVQRGLEFVPTLSEPVFNNGFTAELVALLDPRLDLQAGAHYSTGGSALTRGANTFDAYNGTVRIRYAVAQSLAAFAEYVYYLYDFRRNPQLALGIPPQLEMQGIRVGVTLWVPVRRR